MAQEVYESKEYLKNNSRVISSEKLDRECLLNLTSLKYLSEEEMKSIVG